MRRRPLACLLVLAAAIVVASPATGSELVQDANVAFVSLKVNAKGEALLTYRRTDGRLRRVLAWGGIRPYDGPALPILVTACRAPDGTYWGVQTWQRRLPLLGFDPWLPHHSNVELHLSHFSGELPKLEVHPNWTYHGRWQGVFGRYTYLGQPIYGFGANAKGVPKDKYGRNVYIDTLNSSYGSGWKRESGILTHRDTGTFCHSFVPQRRSRATRARRSALRLPASGTASRSAARA